MATRNKIGCSPERMNTEDCPVFKVIGECFTDRHHLQFPRRDIKSRIEKTQRKDPNYQLDVCRALHNSIHASGYQPDIPNLNTAEQEQVAQIETGETALRSYIIKKGTL